MEEYFGLAMRVNSFSDVDNGEFVVWNAKTFEDDGFYLFIGDDFEVTPLGRKVKV